MFTEQSNGKGAGLHPLLRLWPLLAFVLLVAILPPPVSAGTMYLSGGPDLTAALSGSNEFSTGTTVPMAVVVENRGLIDMKIVRNDLVSRDDLPNTAKLVKIGLAAGDASVTVKSDPQMIGDLAGGASKTVPFEVKISSDAPAGLYNLSLQVEYTYLYAAESEGQDNLRYFYKTEQKTLILPIHVKSAARLAMEKVETDHLNVGTEGYLIITIKNVGNEDAAQGVLRIARNGNSPVMPTDSSMYLESLSQGAELTARFKVSISSTAEGDQVYPLDMVLYYQNQDGDTVHTESVTFGVPVGGKVDFSIVSGSAEIAP
ncbi:MAG: S-layer protein, partial [Methanomicrobiales archaeon]|nr:S-layer protein [Methanomicrobiales archaeon]MDD1679960.1 S-layer protein [Methanomicrobiales archaeon]